MKKRPDLFCGKIGFTDTNFTSLFPIWSYLILDNQTGLALPNWFSDYYNGTVPSHAAAENPQRWDDGVETLYNVLNIKGSHWVVMVVSFPGKTITIYDCMPHIYPDKDLEEFVEPFAKMIPYVVRKLNPNPDGATADLQSEDPYRVIRITEGVPKSPPGHNGECGVYALKFIECLSMGVEMSEDILCDDNMPKIRKKLASEMYDELKEGGDMSKDVYHISCFPDGESEKVPDEIMYRYCNVAPPEFREQNEKHEPENGRKRNLCPPAQQQKKATASTRAGRGRGRPRKPTIC